MKERPGFVPDFGESRACQRTFAAQAPAERTNVAQASAQLPHTTNPSWRSTDFGSAAQEVSLAT